MSDDFRDYVRQSKSYERDMPTELDPNLRLLAWRSMWISMVGVVMFYGFTHLINMHYVAVSNLFDFLNNLSTFLSKWGLVLSFLNALFAVVTGTFLISRLKLVPRLHWMPYIAIGLAMLDLAVIFAYLLVVLIIAYLVMVLFLTVFAFSRIFW